MVIGGAGSGKSTLAIMLGEKTGLPVVHMDKMYWLPGWVERDRPEMQQMARDAADGDEWIIDGNNSATIHYRLDRADALIFLDIHILKRLWRVIWRSITSYGKVRPDMQEGCPEKFDWDFLKFVMRYGGDGRIRTLRFLQTIPEHVDVFHLQSKSEVDDFLHKS